MAQQQGVAVFPGQRCHLQEGFRPFGQGRQYRLQVDHQQTEHVDGGGADGQHFLFLAVFFGQGPGRLVGDVAVGVIRQGHDFAHGFAEFALFVELGQTWGGFLYFADQ